MVDTSGAVLLSDHSMPTAPVSHPTPAGGTWGDWSRDSGFQPMDARTATLWLMAASILQALMLHVRRGRGELFGLDTRDPKAVTIGQLAALLRPHNGSAGQAFEFAVADTINFARPANVQERIREATAAIGVPMQRPGAVVIGLEKVTDPRAFTDALHPLLSEHQLRTAGPGRPPNAMKAIKRYLKDGGGVDYGRGELAAADLLIYDRGGTGAVTASVKISSLWSHRWDEMIHPRLLLTTDESAGYFADRLPPGRVAVGIADERWMLDFKLAFDRIFGALADLDWVRPGHYRWHLEPSLGNILDGRRTVAEAVADLQERAHTLAGVYDLQLKQRGPFSVETAQDLLLPDDAPATVAGIERAALVTPAHQFYTRRESGLIVPSRGS